MAITAELVKELRQRTNAGLMDCKAALQETNGDIEAAIVALRKKGQLKAEKKAGRITTEGLIFIKVSADKHKAIMLEILCETDFVAREKNFINFGEQLAQHALDNEISNAEDLSASQLGDHTVAEVRQALVTKKGENIQLRRIHLIKTEGEIASYMHGGRIGVLLEYHGDDENLAKDLTMHVAANAPLVVNAEDVSETVIAKEQEIFKAQAEASGKPAAIIEKMISGRIQKFINEVSLMGQPFVKDPNTSVAKLVQQKNMTVKSFTRYAVGEGIEKKVENFAAEVMSQVKDN
ncbi:MAG: translation elongation factor Ts [Pseudomonadota bacterium]